MSANRFFSICALACLSAPICVAQVPASAPKETTRAADPADPLTAKAKVAGQHAHRSLSIETKKIPSELAEVFSLPPRCDADGNFYIRTNPEGDEGVRKLNSKGERVALFQAKSQDLKVNRPTDFSIGPDGDVYQIVNVWDISQYVFAYKSDGSVRSEIKLQTGFRFSPYLVGVFPSGDLLVSGLKYDHDRNNPVTWPFTGIFSSGGDLRKELVLEDDQKIDDLAASGDPKVASVQNPSFNHAVSQGAMATAQDGNVYLMRRLSPAIFYAISAGGEVVRRFTVDSGEESFMPVTMHIAGSRIAVLFRQEQTRKEIIKVIDLEGHEVATYDEPVKDGRPALGMAFVCYTNNPEEFTFLTNMENDRLGLVIASPR